MSKTNEFGYLRARMAFPSLCSPALLSAALVLAAPALAADPEPSNRLVVGTFTVYRGYPIGFDQQLILTFKQRIGDSDDILYRTRFWSVDVMAAWNPANWSARVEAITEPIAIFQLRVAYDVRGFFGNLGALYSSNNPDQDIRDSILNTASYYGGNVQGLTVEPALQAAFGPVALRNTFGIEYAQWTTRNGDAYVYDPGPDILRASKGWTLTETLTAGYLDPRLFAGLLYQWIDPLALPGKQVHRAGPLIGYTFFDRGAQHGWFNKPTLWGLATFNLVHPGRGVDQGFPFIPTWSVAFSCESDLLPATSIPARMP